MMMDFIPFLKIVFLFSKTMIKLVLLTHNQPDIFFLQFVFPLSFNFQSVTGLNQLNFLSELEGIGHKIHYCDFLNCCLGWYLQVSMADYGF